MFALRLRATADGSGGHPAGKAVELTVLIVAPNVEEARVRASALLAGRSEWRQLQFLEQGEVGDPAAMPAAVLPHVAHARDKGIAVVVFPS